MVTKKKTVKKTVKKETVEEVKTPEEELTAEENVSEKPEPEVKKTATAIGSLKGGKKVYQKINTVRLQSLRGPISKSKLPEDIQRWLTNKGYGTNVYMKDKEWLERHNVNMEMVEKLKKFINDNYL